MTMTKITPSARDRHVLGLIYLDARNASKQISEMGAGDAAAARRLRRREAGNHACPEHRGRQSADRPSAAPQRVRQGGWTTDIYSAFTRFDGHADPRKHMRRRRRH